MLGMFDGQMLDRRSPPRDMSRRSRQVTPWYEDDREVLARMRAWRGDGHPPNYLQWAWHQASSSLKRVVANLSEKQADDLVFQAFMTSGRRCMIRVDWFLEKYGKGIK